MRRDISPLVLFLNLDYSFAVSTTELKRTVDSLSESERVYAAAYLKALSLTRSEAYRTDISQRMKDMDAGRSLDAAAIKELHRTLDSKGL